MAAVPPRPERGLSDSMRRKRTRMQWLFVLPFVGTFFPWIYNFRDPELIGIPFFYWYQMLWVPVTVAITVVVYRATRRRA